MRADAPFQFENSEARTRQSGGPSMVYAEASMVSAAERVSLSRSATNCAPHGASRTVDTRQRCLLTYITVLHL